MTVKKYYKIFWELHTTFEYAKKRKGVEQYINSGGNNSEGDIIVTTLIMFAFPIIA